LSKEIKNMQNNIVTTSTEEALDFACNLAVSGVLVTEKNQPENAPELLRYLAQYIQFRYVGEFQRAVEYLSDIGNLIEMNSFSSIQFWSQISWLAHHMELEVTEIKSLHIPSI
jgi:hypothetical protein